MTVRRKELLLSISTRIQLQRNPHHNLLMYSYQNDRQEEGVALPTVDAFTTSAQPSPQLANNQPSNLQTTDLSTQSYQPTFNLYSKSGDLYGRAVPQLLTHYSVGSYHPRRAGGGYDATDRRGGGLDAPSGTPHALHRTPWAPE